MHCNFLKLGFMDEDASNAVFFKKNKPRPTSAKVSVYFIIAGVYARTKFPIDWKLIVVSKIRNI
jgi:hypothetical protein